MVVGVSAHQAPHVLCILLYFYKVQERSWHSTDYRICCKLLSQAVLLSLFILSLPFFRAKLTPPSPSPSFSRSNALSTPDPTSLGSLRLLFRDLSKEGLLRPGDKTLIVTGQNGGTGSSTSALLNNAAEGSSLLARTAAEVETISDADVARQCAVANGSFDFAFTTSFYAASEFIERAVKPGGIVVVEMARRDPGSSAAMERPEGNRVVYLRRFESFIFVGMRKGAAVAAAGEEAAVNGRVVELSVEERRKEALRNLEDVLLEPPRAASGKSRTYRKKTRFLPDLLNDSLEGYPRRVFVDVAEKGGANGTKWFEQNYPTRNQHFEIYHIETVPETQTELAELEVWGAPQFEMSDWLRRNVRDEEYVVMKAEAEVVEEMVKTKEALELVDELFLECKPKGKGSVSGSWNKRAYWECLALYGRLRDLDIAVHQWWG